MTTTIRTNGRVLVVIDGDNLRHQLRGIRIDIGLLRDWATAYGWPEIHWYQGEHPRAAAFLQVLRTRGVRVHTRAPKLLPDGRRKCDLDVALAVGTLEAAQRCDTVVLVSGDGDFEPLVTTLLRRGLRVVVVSDEAAAAPELRQHLDPHDFVALDAVVAACGLSGRGEAA
jgi:uncharacterized LabA/DUF88 family protein